jgi:hypothetical protein
MLRTMMAVRASALVLFAGALFSTASCAGDTTVNRTRGNAGKAGRAASVPENDGGEAGSETKMGGGSGAQAGASATPGSGGSAAQHARAGRGGTQASGGRGGNSASVEGGAGAGATPDGIGGTAGAGHGGNQGAIAGEAGDGNTAGAGGAGIPEQLSLCTRLGDFNNATNLDLYVTLDFENAFAADCRINWVFSLYYDSATQLNQRYDFLNQLLAFNFELWGCFGSPPPDSFDLIYKPHPLSRADRDLLIDEYVAVATDDLSMSPNEVAAMREWLVYLSDPLIISPDPGGFSQPNCSTKGGAGGEGGEAGAAGQPAQAGRASGGQSSGGAAATAQAGTG